MNVSVLPAQVMEGSDATFTISSSTVLSQGVTVRYAMAGRAQQGVDYMLDGTPGQVTIGAGQSAATVVLHAVADHVKEKNESVTMILNSGAGYQIPRRARAALTILDGP